VLFEHAQKREYDTMKFNAALQGVDLDKGKEKETGNPVTEKFDGVELFGDPKDYENLSQEEKERKTKELMTKMKSWASGKTITPDGRKTNTSFGYEG